MPYSNLEMGPYRSCLNKNPLGWILSIFVSYHIFPLYKSPARISMNRAVNNFKFSEIFFLLLDFLASQYIKGLQSQSLSLGDSGKPLPNCECSYVVYKFEIALSWLFITTYKGAPHCRVTVLARKTTVNLNL